MELSTQGDGTQYYTVHFSAITTFLFVYVGEQCSEQKGEQIGTLKVVIVVCNSHGLFIGLQMSDGPSELSLGLYWCACLRKCIFYHWLFLLKNKTKFNFYVY
jgi:hypothetical protein